MTHNAPDGLLGPRGYRTHADWTQPGQARARGQQILAAMRADKAEIVRNPHREFEWADSAVRSPVLLAAVQAVLGSALAIENTFLVVKWPDREFVVPWHQDGTGADIELDAFRSVSAWLAVTDATTTNGCLEVIGGSQRLGYLPVEKEPDLGAERGQANQSAGFSSETATAVPVRAGRAVLMDSRLVHRSRSNTAAGARIGLNVRYIAPGGIVRSTTTSPSVDPISGSGW